MKNLISVTTPKGATLLLDPANVTGLVYYPSDKLMQLCNAQGDFVNLECPLGIEDMQSFAVQLNAAGGSLYTLVDGASLVYVSPAAVCYATTNIHGAVLVGMQGIGVYETKNGPAWQALFAAVKQTGNTVLSYGADVAHTRYSEPAELHVVPAHIISINGDGCVEQLNVSFSQCGSLDVQIGSESVRSAMFATITKKYWTELRENFADLNEVYAVARKDVEQFTVQARRDVAASWAAAAGARLTEIQNSQRPIYVQMQDFDHAFAFDPQKEGGKYNLCLRGKKDSRHAIDGITAYFNTAKERDASLDALKQSLVKKVTGTDPKPPAH